ncbi:MAG: hypothetical protein DLM57_02480 [Pseudonocardiales bacterium]|nr:MAG: hypothetical protein DLM57_02480 [Pseudonocardiales bacterium]
MVTRCARSGKFAEHGAQVAEGYTILAGPPAGEIIGIAITRSDGNRLAPDARASAVLHDVRTIFDNIH